MLLLLLLLLQLSPTAFAGEGTTAYAVVVSNEPYLEPARVLGQRLKSLDPHRARLLIVVDSVLEHHAAPSVELLAAEGWTVRVVPRIPNPFAGADNYKSQNVFSKLHIWSPHATMGFERLLFMDIDVFPVSSPAALLGCRGAVCAPTAASEWRSEVDVINTGVMVVEPGAVVSEQLGKASREIRGSYNKGDQGFLNLFFVEWCVRPERPCGRALLRNYSDCRIIPHLWSDALPLWEPAAAAAAAGGEEGGGAGVLPALAQSCPEQACQRFSLRYNWNPYDAIRQSEETKPVLVHYNYVVWKFKPWFWAVLPLFPSFYPWTKARRAAAMESPGPAHSALRALLLGIALAPLALLLLETRRRRSRRGAGGTLRAACAEAAFDAAEVVGLREVAIGALALALAYVAMLLAVPKATEPAAAWSALFALQALLSAALPGCGGATCGAGGAVSAGAGAGGADGGAGRSRQWCRRAVRRVPAAVLVSAMFAFLVWGPFLVVVLSFETGVLQGWLQSAATAGVVPAPPVLYPLHSAQCGAGWVAWAAALALMGAWVARTAKKRLREGVDKSIGFPV